MSDRTQDPATELAELVMRDLAGRSGILDDVELSVQDDIEEELREKIRAKLKEMGL